MIFLFNSIGRFELIILYFFLFFDILKKPFCTFGGCPIVSPLKFAKDNLAVLVETSKLGLINDIAIAPQAGATAPVTLAGTLAQVTAEGLACLAVVNFIRSGCPMSFAIWPFISDLRTGSFSGGSGEEALIVAARLRCSVDTIKQLAGFCCHVDGWEDPHVHDNPETRRRAALEMGANIAVWALSR